jgi:PAS domain S-box-containing protein
MTSSFKNGTSRPAKTESTPFNPDKLLLELEQTNIDYHLFLKEQLMVSDVLQFINETDDLKNLIQGVVHLFKKWSGCEAVGIRIKNGPDYPYFETSGFPERFVELERNLCIYDENGHAKCDKHGNPLLECMCGNVILERTDSSKSFFTSDGSFWSNCTTKLLATTTDADRQTRTRNLCNGSGYESVALIPLRSGGSTFGLIQLNDHREGMFSSELIAMYRRVTDYVASVLARKQAEEERSNSESRLRTLINTLPDLIWLKDPNGVYLACNHRVEQFFGAREEEIIGKTDYDFMNKELADFFRHHDRLAMIAGKACVNEEEITFPDDGHREFLETTKTPIYDDKKNIMGILGIGHNITARKQNEIMLKKSEEQLRLFIEHTPATIAMFDTQMSYIAASSRWISDYRLEDEEIKGRSHYDIFPEIPDHWKQIHRQGMEGMVSRADEECFERLDGTTQWLMWEVRPWYKTDNTVGGIIILTEDITKRKQIESEHDNMKNQLVQAQKMESIGRLAGGIAHDLNNLLSPILGYGEMMLEDLWPNDEKVDSVREILQAGTRARDLVRQLLAFSRKQTLEFKPVDINNIIESFKKLLIRTIPEDIEIHYALSNKILPIMADIGQIEQVIMNLSVNAADSMPNGGKLSLETALVFLDKAYVSMHTDVKPGPHVMMAITDTGTGMSRETQDHIFDPFFSTKGEHGTGLGLSTVYGIIKQHDGHIWVYSEPYQGTSIKIYLPVTQKIKTHVPELKTTTKSLEGSETIILVEDNDQVLKLAERILKKQGYRVIPAPNGQEAIETMKKHEGPVHLLLTDVVMQGMNGRELYETVIMKYPNVKALFMSGYTDNIIAHRGILEEGLHFIQKPFSKQSLTTKVREVLDEII